MGIDKNTYRSVNSDNITYREERVPMDGCGCGHNHDQDELEVSFFSYLASMGYQAMIFLGAVPNPVTQEVSQNMRQAKFLIDTITMVREKTQGNLSLQEDQFINSTLNELRIKYVEVSNKGIIV
jgi:hypothetical protein